MGTVFRSISLTIQSRHVRSLDSYEELLLQAYNLNYRLPHFIAAVDSMAMLLGAWYIPIVVTAGGSIWSFFQGKLSEEVTFFPEDDDETLRDATVRIWAGMTSKRSDSAAINPHGFMPHAILYDERGEMTGKSCGRRRFVKEGDFQDIKIPARGGHNARPGYLELIACKFIIRFRR